MAKSITEMLAPTTVDPDATLTSLDVFEEKSKDADDAIEYGMGLSPEEILEIAMSVTPMGRAKAGKGAISFLKGLLGKAKSKNIAKPNRKETEKIINKLMKSLPEDEAFMREVAEYERIKGLVKPKGMRQFGKFNRKKWEK